MRLGLREAGCGYAGYAGYSPSERGKINFSFLYPQPYGSGVTSVTSVTGQRFGRFGDPQTATGTQEKTDSPLDHLKKREGARKGYRMPRISLAPRGVNCVGYVAKEAPT